MMRRVLVFALLVVAVSAAATMPAAAKPRGLNGKIALNSDNNVTGQEQVYLIDPDGSDRQLLANDAETGQWSPDGTKLACCGGVMNPDTGVVGPPTFDLLQTLYPDRLLFCNVWSPDGARLACEGGFLDQDVDGVSQLQGIYTVSSSDGTDLERVTSNTDPYGDDCPGDFSPNGKQLVFLRASNSGLAFFTVRLDGSGLTRITPYMEMNFSPCGSWSQQGNEIVFSAHVPAADRGTLWLVHSDGSGLHQIPVPGCGGVANLPDGSRNPDAIGCSEPTWSPDGTKVLFTRQRGSEQSDAYIVNSDGSGLFQLTNTPDISEGGGAWGTHPITP
jgi:Tol biopolymer transport system component